MVSRNNSTMKQSWVAECCCPHYRLQKLTIGVASVLLGTTLYFGGSTIVHADTVATGSEENSVVKPVGSDTVGSTTVPTTSTSTRSELTNDAGDNAQTEVNSPQSTNDKVTGDSANVPSSAPTGAVSQDQRRSQAGTDSSTLVSVVPASTNVTPTGDTTGTYQLTNLRAFVMPAAGLMESKVATTTNGGYDQAKWGVLNTRDWSLNPHDDGKMWLDSYHGDTQHVIIPNAADFGQAWRDEIYISPELIHKLVVDDHSKTLAISKTDGKKVAVIDDYVYRGRNGGQLCNAFGGTAGTDGRSYFDTGLAPNAHIVAVQETQANKSLTNLDLTNLDVSQVTSGFGMFNNLRALQEIGDLSGWNTHNFTDMRFMFDSDSALSGIGDLSNWNTSKVTNMIAMFESASNLKDLGNLGRWRTGNVTDMGYMFNGMSALTNVGDLSNWDTSKVTNMRAMFAFDSNLKNLGNLDHWRTGNVTDMSYMFNADRSLTNVGDLSHWDTHNVTDMSFMFDRDSALSSIGDLSNWNTAKVTNMKAMFELTNLKDLGSLDRWQTGNVTDMSFMFNQDGSLTNVGDLSHWDTHNVTDMNHMFAGDSALSSLGDLSNWNTSKVTNMSSMFESARNLKDLGNLDRWQTGNVTDMSFMFNQDGSLINIGDLSYWDTSKVTNMNAMFQFDSNLKNLGNLDHWQTGNVTDMSHMFNQASSLTSLGNLSHWDTHNVKDMQYMFARDSALSSIGDLSNWDTSKVTNMGSMFELASNLKNLGNLDRWQTGNVTDMSFMFSVMSALTNVGDLSNWDTSKVTKMNSMFQSDSNLKDLGDLGRWKTGNVTDMSYMFSMDGSLTNVGDLSHWDTHNVTDMSYMFNQAGFSTSFGDLSNWDVHNVKDMSFMFNYMPNAAQLSNNFSKWKMDNVTTVQSMFGSPEAQKRFNISNFNLANVSADAAKQAMTDFIGTPESLVIANHVSFPAVDLKAQQTFGDQSVVLTDNQDLLAKTKDNAPVDTIKFVDQQGHLVASYQRPVFYQDTGVTDINYDNALSVVKPIVDQSNQQFLQNEIVNGHSLASLYQLQSLDENDPIKYANGTFTLVPVRNSWKLTLNYKYADHDSTLNKFSHKVADKAGQAVMSDTVIEFAPQKDASGKLTGLAIKQTGTNVTVDKTEDKGIIPGEDQNIDGILLEKGKSYHVYTFAIHLPRDYDNHYHADLSTITETVYLDTSNGSVSVMTPDHTSTVDFYDVYIPTQLNYQYNGKTISSVAGPRIYLNGQLTNLQVDDHVPAHYQVDPNDQHMTVFKASYTPSTTGQDQINYQFDGKPAWSTDGHTLEDNVKVIDKLNQSVETTTRTVTVHYKYADGPKKDQQASPDAVLEVYYKRNKLTNEVTGKSAYGFWNWDTSRGDNTTPGYHVVSGKWTNLPQDWDVVIADVPEITGYVIDTSGDSTNTNHVPANDFVYPSYTHGGASAVGSEDPIAYTTTADTYEARPEHTIWYRQAKSRQQTVVFHLVDADTGEVIAKDVTLRFGYTQNSQGNWTFEANQNDHGFALSDPDHALTITGLHAGGDSGQIQARISPTLAKTYEVVSGYSLGLDHDGMFGPENSWWWTENNHEVLDQTLTLRRRQAPIMVNYLDATTNQAIGKPVTVNGKVGLAQTVDLTTGLLDGYQLFGGVSQTISLTPITAAGVSYDVLVKHHLAFINSYANYTTDSVIPGTKAKHFTTALGPAQLTSTVHRQIVIKDASGKVVKTVPQTITFVRNAVVDAVTGQVQYLNWSYDGQYVLLAYQPVARDGYQINAAPSIQVTPMSKLADVELQYQAIAAPQKVAFVTSDGSVLATKDLSSNGDFSSLVPAGYRAATTSSVISQRDLAQETTYQVLVEPNVTTYTDRDQLPSQVKEPLVKTITRTINIMMPNGRVRKVIQWVRFTRTVTVSTTGEVTYGNWTGVGRTSFNHLFVPERHGYRLVMTDSHGQTLTGVDKMVVDATMDDMVINVKYVK